MKDIFEKIDRDDLTPDLELVCSVCGMDCVRELLRHLAGIRFYIPKISRLNGFIKRYIMEHPDKPPRDIAKDLYVSETFIISLKRSLEEEGSEV